MQISWLIDSIRDSRSSYGSAIYPVDAAEMVYRVLKSLNFGQRTTRCTLYSFNYAQENWVLIKSFNITDGIAEARYLFTEREPIFQTLQEHARR